MMKDRHITGFYIETLLLIVVFIAIIMLLTHVFGLARNQSDQAKDLTAAVTLAENAAEAVSLAEDPQELCLLLDKDGSAQLLAAGDGVAARYDADLAPDAAGDFIVDITWTPQETASGTLVDSEITVNRGGDTIYTLNTAVYLDAAGDREGR